MPCLAEPRIAPHGAHRLASPRDAVHRRPDENDPLTGHPQVESAALVHLGVNRAARLTPDSTAPGAGWAITRPSRSRECQTMSSRSLVDMSRARLPDSYLDARQALATC